MNPRQNFQTGKKRNNQKEEYSVPEKYLEESDTWQFLKDINKKKTHDVKGTLPFLTTSTPVVEVIFRLCCHLNQPSEVRFMAVDLFDQFMMKHFTDVNEGLEATTSNRSARKRQWKLFKTRLREQSLLRVLSCIQLASKFVSSATKLDTGAVRQLLTASGRFYSTRSIVCSELRVFKTVDFQIPFRTPLTYLEVLLECLRKKVGNELKDVATSLYSVCVAVLDVACLQRQELYHRFFWMATSRWERTPQERIKFLQVESDYVFLAASVILCAIQIWRNSAFLINLASDQLSKLTNTPVKEIKGFASLISHSIFGSRTFDVIS